MVLLVAGCSSSTTTAGTSAPIAPAPVITPSAAASSSKPVSAGSLAAWYNGGGKGFLAMLATDISNTGDDDRQHDNDAITTDCLQLTGDLSRAEKYAPVPDPQAQASWSSALITLHQGFWDCNGGFSENNPGQVRTGVAEIESAGPALEAASKRIASLID